MDAEAPHWPARLSREQARDAKLRSREFEQALKVQAKTSGWKIANGSLFREDGDWFVSLIPSLLWQQGALASLSAKPMAVDPLFWRIVGLEENERLPLSFRANGAWVLRAPSHQAHIAPQEHDPAKLAAATIAWATDQLPDVRASSPEKLLRQIENLGDRRQHFVALEVSLRLLLQDVDGAMRLCTTSDLNDSGGFQTGDKSFFQQAQGWICSHCP
jgi:hypothetical protein